MAVESIDSSLPPAFIVIGGGAAGFFAAIRAKTLCPSLQVTILESAPKVLGKVKISGGGRCNVTHACFDPATLVQYYPRGQRELKGIFTRFGPKDTVKWFESHGVPLKTEEDGRMFPTTDESQTIIDCLIDAARDLGIAIQTKAPVEQITLGRRWTLTTPKGTYQADAILIATGSAAKGFQWVKQLGHQLIDPAPSLFTFIIADKSLTELAGIRFDKLIGTLEVPGQKPLKQEGDLLITHWGLSGPLVLRLSAWGARMLASTRYQASLKIDFCPQQSVDTIQQILSGQKQQTAKKHVGNDNPFELPKRFWHKLLADEAIDPEGLWGAIANKSLNRLSERLKRCPFAITGKGQFKDEFVTAGGVPLKELDMKTMASRLHPSLYLAGEIIDVDGLTGGFNFQNAWSTGWIAGQSAAQQLMQIQAGQPDH